MSKVSYMFPGTCFFNLHYILVTYMFHTRKFWPIKLTKTRQFFVRGTFVILFLPRCTYFLHIFHRYVSFTLPDSNWSISRNVASLNMFVHDVINVLYDENWTDELQYLVVSYAFVTRSINIQRGEAKYWKIDNFISLNFFTAAVAVLLFWTT